MRVLRGSDGEGWIDEAQGIFLGWWNYSVWYFNAHVMTYTHMKPAELSSTSKETYCLKIKKKMFQKSVDSRMGYRVMK